MANRTGYVPPWSHEFREGVACLFCGNTERVVLCGPSDATDSADSGADLDGTVRGVCEACSVIAHWVWRNLSEGIEPVERARAAKCVRVLVSRLGKLPDGQLANPAHPVSYEFLYSLAGPDGLVDLPSGVLTEGEEPEAAVLRILANLGITSWRRCVEPLYVGHTYRGGLASVYLVTAYGDVPGAPRSSAGVWRQWPVADHVSSAQAGFYQALEHVWPLRISKHRSTDPRADQVSTYLRRGAVEYVGMQLALIVDPATDTSMAEYLRKSMTADEKLVCKLVVDAARLDAERAASEAESSDGEQAEAVAPEDSGAGDDLPTEVVGESSDEGTLDDAFSEGSDG